MTKSIAIALLLLVAGCGHKESRPADATTPQPIWAKTAQGLTINCPRGWMVEYDRVGTDEAKTPEEYAHVLAYTMHCRQAYEREIEREDAAKRDVAEHNGFYTQMLLNGFPNQPPKGTSK